MSKDSRKKIEGVFPPIITVFRKDGTFDEKGQRQFVNFLLENGVHGVIPCGSTGEFITMTDEERKQVFKVVIDEVAHRVPVYAHIGHYSTDNTVKLAQYAQELEADGVMMITPYYLPRYEEEIYRHCETVSNSIDIPIMLYHNPHFSGCKLSNEFIASLYKDEIISALKEGEGEVSRISDLRYRCGDGFSLFYGYDTAPIETFIMGANGWVAGTANLLPREISQIYELTNKEKKLEEAKGLWFKIKPYMDLCTQDINGKNSPWLAILKEGLSMRNVVSCFPRRPAFTLEEMGSFGQEVKEKLYKILKELDHI